MSSSEKIKRHHCSQNDRYCKKKRENRAQSVQEPRLPGRDTPGRGGCPRGRKAEDGPIGGQYQLIETPTGNYLQRTEWNVRDSDGTVIFTLAREVTGGSLHTIDFARKHKKPCAHILRVGHYQAEEALKRFVSEHGIKTLNVAGSRESKEPGLHLWVTGVIEDAFFSSKAHPGMIGGSGEGRPQKAMKICNNFPSPEALRLWNCLEYVSCCIRLFLSRDSRRVRKNTCNSMEEVCLSVQHL